MEGPHLHKCATKNRIAKGRRNLHISVEAISEWQDLWHGQLLWESANQPPQQKVLAAVVERSDLKPPLSEPLKEIRSQQRSFGQLARQRHAQKFLFLSELNWTKDYYPVKSQHLSIRGTLHGVPRLLRPRRCGLTDMETGSQWGHQGSW